MTDQTHDLQTGYVELTADLVAAYVSNNSVPDKRSLAELAEAACTPPSAAFPAVDLAALEADKIQKATPAQIKKSITPDHLISFEDGKPYRTIEAGI